MRPFKLQFRMFRGRKKSGRINTQDVEAYSLKMQEARRRLSLVRDAVKSGRAQEEEYMRNGLVVQRRASGAKRARRASRSSFSLTVQPPTRSLTGEAAHQDMEIAAAKMQALVRGRNSRSSTPISLRRKSSSIAPACSEPEALTKPGGGAPSVRFTSTCSVGTSPLAPRVYLNRAPSEPVHELT